MSAPERRLYWSIDVVSKCIEPYEKSALVEDDSRDAVIDVLDACWMAWSHPLKVATVEMLANIGVHILDGSQFRQVLSKATNEQLSTALWAIWANGGLLIRMATRQ